MSDRIVGAAVVLIALAFFISAGQLETPFFADPLGPKTFPRIVAAVAALCGLVMILSPDESPDWPAASVLARLGLAVIVLVAYAYALKPLGFLLPTALAASLLSYQIKPRVLGAVLTGALLAAILFLIFKYALGLSLFAFPRRLDSGG